MATVFNTVRVATDYVRSEDGNEVIWTPSTTFDGYQVVRDGYEFGIYAADGTPFASKKAYEAQPLEADVPTPDWWVEP